MKLLLLPTLVGNITYGMLYMVYGCDKNGCDYSRGGMVIQKIIFYLVILIIFFPKIVMAIEPVPKWPPDWPDVSKFTLKCDDIVGTYVDPNTQYRHEKKLENGVIEGYGGLPDFAWFVLGFQADLVQFFDKSKQKNRSFSFNFDENKSLVIGYYIDGKVIASKSVLANDYICKDGKVNFISYERTGKVLDKFPNHGYIQWTVSAFRIRDKLYIYQTDKTKARTFGFIPFNMSGALWYRYDVIE